MEKIVVGNRTYTVLFPELVRQLRPAERAAMRKSIEAHGVQDSVHVDEDDGIIDGANRLRLAGELGKVVGCVVHPGLNEAQKRKLALSLNLDRRHLGPRELEEAKAARVGRVVEKRRQGKSTRKIAEEEGVDQATVVRDLQHATDADASGADLPEMTTGCDGREYPAKRPEPKPEPIIPLGAREKSKAIDLAYEAINCLKRVPLNDPRRKESFRLVVKFIKGNP